MKISNLAEDGIIMDRQSEAESTGDGNAIDEYYGFSTLGNLGDSYFTQPFGPQYYRNDSNPSPIPNQSVPIGSSLAHPAGYAPSVPQIVEPTPYPLVYPQNQMDLGIMSADNYQRGYAQVGRMQGRMGNPRLYGKILGSNQPRAVSPSPSISTRTRRSRKESPKGSSPEEASSTRQRGRPRLGPRDQSATEVSHISRSIFISA